MIKRKPTKPRETEFDYFPEFTVGRRTLRPGDPCKVKYQRRTWTFKAHVRNTKTGHEWLDVISPATMHGPGSVHAVKLENVTPVPVRRRKK